MLTVAVDWSGRATGAARAIWTAVVRDGVVLQLADGRSREAAVDHVVALAAADADLVVGFDFSFSFPAWFVRALGAGSGPELWPLVAELGEGWLAACEPPFWGQPGRRRPDGDAPLRRTELALGGVGGTRPKSTFQVGGAGTVGTGSIRGMPQLARLRAAGFSVWPFDAPRPPAAFEIWPRVLTGPVVKSRPPDRRRHLEERFPHLDATVSALASASEDAFDALVSALVMDRHRAALLSLPAAADEVGRLEGEVWAGPAG